jgi:hypothetical protein
VDHGHGESTHALGKDEQLPVPEVAREDQHAGVPRPADVLRPPGLVLELDEGAEVLGSESMDVRELGHHPAEIGERRP